MADCARPGDSSVMMWTAGNLDFVYEKFVTHPTRYMDEAGSCGRWIASACTKAGIVPDWLRDLVPHLMGDIRAVPGGAPLRAIAPNVGLISFKGGPKPHELADSSELIRDHWV